ncbi:hypothetical protein MKMG_02053 [Methanogenium sp. MK-MG]|nr:hypothetical protein MKMG_02053 [Methanogenium sp. MK-MG]
MFPSCFDIQMNQVDERMLDKCLQGIRKHTIRLDTNLKTHCTAAFGKRYQCIFLHRRFAAGEYDPGYEHSG